MRSFVDDDAGYQRWLATHLDGFVLNTERQPTATYLMLHRATCHTISGAPARGSRWTADYVKHCGNRNELERFACQDVGGAANPCGICIR